MTERVYRVSLVCETEGHLMDDGSIPTCTRKDCDEGMQMIDYYCDLEEEMCTCTDTTTCYWHGGEA